MRRSSLLVIDTLTAAGLGTDGDNAAAWLDDRLGRFRARGHATLAVAHLPKNRPGAADPIGSGSQSAWFDAVYTLRSTSRHVADAESSATLKLTAQKIRHAAVAEGTTWALFALDEIDDQRSRLTVAPYSTSSAAVLDGSAPDHTQVLELLAEHPEGLNTKQIAKRLDMPRTSLRRKHLTPGSTRRCTLRPPTTRDYLRSRPNRPTVRLVEHLGLRHGRRATPTFPVQHRQHRCSADPVVGRAFQGHRGRW